MNLRAKNGYTAFDLIMLLNDPGISVPLVCAKLIRGLSLTNIFWEGELLPKETVCGFFFQMQNLYGCWHQPACR